MRRLQLQEDWPDSWKYSYPYDLQEIYSEIADWGYAYAYQTRRRKTLRMIKDVLPRGATVLDIAGAQGNFSLSLAEMGYRVTWNDLREELAGYVQRKHELGILEFAPGNAFELEFEKPFDCVLATEIIEHVAHPDQFLRKAAELVRPGGYIILTTPNGAYFRNQLPRFSDCENPSQFEKVQFGPNSDGHIFLMWPDELTSLGQEAGLSVEKVELFTNPLTVGHLKTGRLHRCLPCAVVTTLEQVSGFIPIALSRRLMTHAAIRYRRKLDT